MIHLFNNVITRWITTATKYGYKEARIGYRYCKKVYHPLLSIYTQPNMLGKVGKFQTPVKILFEKRTNN